MKKIFTITQGNKPKVGGIKTLSEIKRIYNKACANRISGEPLKLTIG